MNNGKKAEPTIIVIFGGTVILQKKIDTGILQSLSRQPHA
jgi:hypothetical protein